MAYNPNMWNETTLLPKDSILDGVVVDIKDGKTSDFVEKDNLAGWKGDINSPAIEVTVEVKTESGKPVRTTQLFTYVDNKGVTEFSPKSNIGKFHKKYGCIPKVGMTVKVMTDAEGYAKVKLD